MIVSHANSVPRLTRLAWESEHFAFPVARLDARGLSDQAVWSELELARRQRVRMLVLTTPPEQTVNADILAEFAGRLTDRKATFARSISPELEQHLSRGGKDYCISEYRESMVTPALLHLALSAGAYSRFRVDPRFPAMHFVAMYRIWIERSVRREIAGAVLVARNSNSGGALSGFVTVSSTQTTGKIGLIAVAEQARGNGLGRRLVAAAHRWMLDRGAQRAEVVTQLANAPACALYQRCDYALSEVEHYYHLWPLAEAEAS